MSMDVASVGVRVVDRPLPALTQHVKNRADRLLPRAPRAQRCTRGSGRRSSITTPPAELAARLSSVLTGA
jgi:hypothetical protein